MLYMLVSVCESKWSYVLEVPDVDFIRPCGVVVFALFYCHLDLYCVSCLQLECVPIYVSVCFVCFMFDCVGELIAICVGEVSVFSLKVMIKFFITFTMMMSKTIGLRVHLVTSEVSNGTAFTESVVC